MAGREVRDYTNLSDPKATNDTNKKPSGRSSSSSSFHDRKWGKGKDKTDDEDITFQRIVASRAEATASTGSENEKSLDVKAQKALECPCVAELRKGPCGTQFTEAFVCFIKSTAEEKGSDCVNPFIAFQDCIKSNPDAFSKDVLGEEESESGEREEKVEDYKIIPPLWSREPKSRN